MAKRNEIIFWDNEDEHECSNASITMHNYVFVGILVLWTGEQDNTSWTVASQLMHAGLLLINFQSCCSV